MKNNNWIRGAMLLAVGLVLQAVRLVIPMPPMWTVFVVGTLVNMVLVLAARSVGLGPATMIAVLLPVIAYFQGQLPLPFLIPVVAIGNFVMVYFCARFWGKGIIIAAPLFKTFILYCCSLLVLWVVQVPDALALFILFIMGWPQMITGILGLVLGYKLHKRIFPEATSVKKP